MGWDDAIAGAVGAVLGVAGQAIADVVSGSFSGAEAYIGAAAGGATAGVATLYVGPVAAGAIGGAVTNASTQGLKIMSGKQDAFHVSELVVDTTIGAGLGALSKVLPAPKVNKVNVTVDGWNYSEMTTNVIGRTKDAFANKFFGESIEGAITSVSGKTASRMAGAFAVEGATITGASGLTFGAKQGVNNVFGIWK